MTTFVTDHRTDGAIARVSVRGELDSDTGPQVEELIRDVEQHAPQTLVLDLRGVTFFGSTALHIVLDAEVRARTGGRRFVVVPGDGEPRRVLELADVMDRLDLEDPVR